MTKAELRKAYRFKMVELSDEDYKLKSEQIANHFLNHFNLKTIDAVHTFLPIKKNKEVNTWFIIDEIHQHYPEVKIIVPKSDFQTREMIAHTLTKGTMVKENPFGILEPEPSAPFEATQIDMIIVPLLAIDQRGFRVGYGKGFYDRFLIKCRSDIIKVGLSFFDPITEISDINSYDVALDFCVTPSRVYEF